MLNKGLSNDTYNRLKDLTQIGLPAAGSLYFGLAQIWGFPGGEEVVGSLALVATFLGVLLKISTAKYESSGAAFDGSMTVETHANNKKTFALNLDNDPEDLETKDRIVFRVDHEVDQEVEDFYSPEH